MKRFSIVFALSLAICLAFVGSAFANFGPHGGYVNDTDACAGCHRAHTSFSTVGWKDTLGTNHASALLVGNANTMTEFCNACHGDLAPGASTNVASGIFDSGPSAATGHAVGVAQGPAGTDASVDNTSVVTAYQTDSTFNAPLNGGGFNRMPDPYAWQTGTTVAYKAATSAHKMDVSGPLWGSGSAVADFGGSTGMTCTDCHDPHGSSNYRLLKAKPNPAGPVVGGYDDTGLIPTPVVFSNETGYPVPLSVGLPGGGIQDGALPGGGWLKHADGAAQMVLYRPNYTDTTGTPILHTDTAAKPKQSMSIWCSSCHMNYNQTNAADKVSYNYDPYLPASGLDPAAQVGKKDYHRHAVDKTMAVGFGSSRALVEEVVSAPNWVPLENPSSGSGDWDTGYLGCLTCHRAHGSSVEMTGFAASHLSVNASGTYGPVRDGIPGVDPDKGSYNGVNNQGTSALLRADNRGVCERCHNK